MKKMFLILCLGFLILFVSKSSQAQCSCKDGITELTTPATHPFSEEFQKSAAVFIGKVTKVKKEKYSRTIKFKVSSSWKPNTPNNITIKLLGFAIFLL